MTQQTDQTIWIARHATRIDMVDPDWKASADRPFDAHLAEIGHVEADALARRLADEPIDAVYASPFLRALETAAPLAVRTGAPLRIEPGVGEWLQAEWFATMPEMLPGDQVACIAERWDRTYRSPSQLCCPETWEQMASRAADTIHRLAATGENFVLVGHGASVYGTVAALLGRVAENLDPIPPASVYKIVRRGDQWDAELEADASHLAGVE